MLLREKSPGRSSFIKFAVIVGLLLALVASALGQGGATGGAIGFEDQTLDTVQIVEPVFADYRGIAIGTTEAELLSRAGVPPSFESKDDYIYVFSATESAQFVLDADRNVKLISITHSGDDSNAPTYEDVFGPDVALKMTADGRVHNFVNYPDAGFWIAYFRSTGVHPVVTITIQRL